MARESRVVFVLVLFFLTACGEESNPPRDPNTRVIVAGHLYGLGVRSHEEGDDELRSDRYLSVFADEIRARAPAAVFLLGDSTKDGREEEWARLDRVFARTEAPLHYLAGNHDLRAPEVFDRRGGVRNAVFDIADRRFICLDNKCVYEAEDLAFLREALDVGGRPKPVILVHYCMIDWRDAQPGQDPREDYPGVSNWNGAVAPLIAGRVEAVVCGDHQPGGPRLRRQVVGDRTIDYILTSFVFGGGPRQAGEGPNVYLEVLIWGREIRFLPRALPVPVPDDWYLDPRPIEPWARHAIGEAAWIWAPAGFRATSEAGVFRLDDGERGIGLELRRRPWPAGRSFLELRSELSAELAAAEPGLRSLVGADLEILHRPGRWEWLALGDDFLFYAFLRFGDELWIFSGRRPGARDELDWRSLLIEIIRSLKPA